MATLTMFDSVNVANIPRDAVMVAGYVNGIWPTYHTLKSQFKHAHVVSITINKFGVADVLDVEKGDATPADALEWVKKMRGLKLVPIVYCSRSNLPVVQEMFSSHAEPEPYYWVADFTNVEHLVTGSVATQWADGTDTYPGLAKFCDTSLVSPNFPGLAKHVVAKAATKVVAADVAKVTAAVSKPTLTINKGPNQMTVTKETVASIIRQLAAWAGIATQIADTGHLPVAVRTAIVTVSGILLSVEHHAAKP